MKAVGRSSSAPVNGITWKMSAFQISPSEARLDNLVQRTDATIPGCLSARFGDGRIRLMMNFSQGSLMERDVVPGWNTHPDFLPTPLLPLS